MDTAQDTPQATFTADISPAKADQVIDYISQMLSELSDMASEVGHEELAELIRFSGRAAQMEKSIR